MTLSFWPSAVAELWSHLLTQFKMDGPEDKSKHARYNRIDEGLSSGYLAKGTYGKVYIAEDVQSGQVVAVKRQQQYPSEEAARELAFAELLRSNPSAPARVST